MDIINANNLENVVRDRRSLREMFALKFGEWYPKDKAFHTGFALLVLMGKKKLLKLSEQGSPTIPKAKDSPELDKDNLFNIVNNNNELKEYIPDNSKAAYFSIEFFHTLLYHKSKPTFDHLYKIFEERKKRANESIKRKITFEIPSEVSQKIVSYKSNFDIPKSKPFFQVSRYKDLFLPYMQNNRNVNLNVNNVQRNNNDNLNNNDIGMMNNHRDDFNVLPGSRFENLSIIRNRNDMYEDLIRSIFDYIIEIDYNSIGMLIQSNDERNRYKSEIVEIIKNKQNYDSFRELNVDDQVRIVSNIINEIYQNEYALIN